MMSITITRRRFTMLTTVMAILVAANYAPRTTAKQFPRAVSEGALYRGDAQRTGAYNQPAIRENPRLRWSVPIPTIVHESPVFADGVLYFGGADSKIHAYDAVTGAQLWASKSKPSSSAFSPVAVANGVVYVGIEGNRLWALDASTGDRLWKFKAKNVVWTAPLIVNGTVYFGNADGLFYAVDITTQEQRWRINTGRRSLWPAGYDNGTIFLAAENTLYALNSENGQEKWKLEKASAQWWNGPAISAGVVFAGSGDGNFYAIDSQTGAVLWSAPGEGDVWSAAAVADGTVFAGNKDEYFYAFNAQTGERLWRFKAEDWVVADPIVSDGVVYFGVGNHEFPAREGPRHLYSLDAQTGQQLWSYEADGRLLAGVAVGGGAVYFGSVTGKLYAIE
jgi:outer membrane protein assembly factor BamB